jgi:malonyl-CoA O-methyltransferase
MAAKSDLADNARSDFAANLKPSLPPLPVAKGYDRWSATYDATINPTRAAAAAYLRAQPISFNGARVLELGCGTGLDTQWLAERAAEVIALDFSPGMLAVARRRLDAHNVRFTAHDISKRLPVDDGRIDLVVASLVLEHLRDLRPLFAEVRRVLRPGGMFLMCELHPYRQLMGAQARFVDPATQEEEVIEAYPHTIAEFVDVALATDLALVRIDEAASDDMGFPRIFGLTVAAT